MSSSPPKFKKGDMVMYVGQNHSKDIPERFGVIGTITDAPHQRMGEWAYPTDMPPFNPGATVNPVESCLRLIRDGDLKLDDAPAELTLDNLLKVAKWLEESLK